MSHQALTNIRHFYLGSLHFGHFVWIGTRGRAVDLAITFGPSFFSPQHLSIPNCLNVHVGQCHSITILVTKIYIVLSKSVKNTTFSHVFKGFSAKNTLLQIYKKLYMFSTSPTCVKLRQHLRRPRVKKVPPIRRRFRLDVVGAQRSCSKRAIGTWTMKKWAKKIDLWWIYIWLNHH